MKLFAAIIAMFLTASTAVEHRSSANPIRKVVKMLQALQAKVDEEGKKEEELYSAFQCYCQKGAGELEKGIADNQAKVNNGGPEIKADEAKLEQMKQELKQAIEDRSSTKQALKEAKAIRAKEAAAFAEMKASMSGDQKAMDQAITALEKGVGAAFLQTPFAPRLQKFVEAQGTDMDEDDRREVVAFLSAGQDTSYAPASGQIIGILKQMLDTQNKDLSEAIANEKSAAEKHKGLVAAQTKEIEALSKKIESHTKRIGDLGVEIQRKKNAVAAAADALEGDTAFLKDFASSCDNKKAEHDANVEGRNAELVALGETIKFLNNDDALESFNKASGMQKGGESFMQVAVSATAMKARALASIHRARQAGAPYHGKLDLIALMLQSRRSGGGFDKVVKMIDDMKALLKKEQADDDTKKGTCEESIDFIQDKIHGLDRDHADAGKAADALTSELESVAEEIKDLQANIAELDQQVAEGTEQRKKENEQFTQDMNDNGVAKQLINKAKNRMNQFYNPSLAKAELAQVSAHSQATGRPGPAPETAAAYQKSHEGGNAVVHAMDVLLKDIDKEMTTMEAEEKNSAATYEQMVKDASSNKEEAETALTGKQGDLADMKEKLNAGKKEMKGMVVEIENFHDMLKSTHADCDWLLNNHAVRKEARAAEVDNLDNAKAVLSGADYSFLQQGRTQRRALRGGQ